MASVSLRHQSSLEEIIDFGTALPSLNDDQRSRARAKFYRIITHFEAANRANDPPQPYNRPALVRLTHDYARSTESQDNILRAFFNFASVSIDSTEELRLDDNHGDVNQEEKLRNALMGFADFLFDNFFLPLKASTKQTPQPSPAYSAIAALQSPHEFTATPERVAALRGLCLARDRHRCVISRAFDDSAFDLRYGEAGDDALDDDGNLLREETVSFDNLEVAHILPHSLTQAGPDSQLSHAQKTALSILNMFDAGVAHLIDGADVDRPRNALTLTNRLHRLFGNFRVYFKALDQPHTYLIDSTRPSYAMGRLLPITRTLYLTENRTTDPPSPRLLAVHYAISQILHLSAAGEYIDRILRDREDLGAKADGSTALGPLVQLSLNGWLNGAVDAY